jgi:hypothetical protein
MIIKKHCNTQRQAENYLYKLYGMYNSVMCIGWPPNYQSGIYIFSVN